MKVVYLASPAAITIRLLQMNRVNNFASISVIFLILSGNVSGQQRFPAGRTITDPVLDSSYRASRNAALLIYNGPEYFYNESTFNDHVFLDEPGFDNKGTVVFDGVVYENVPLSLDILRDQAVTLSADRNFKVRLLAEKLLYFSLNGRRFVNLPLYSGKGMGYYEILVDAPVALLVKHQKKLKDNTSSTKLSQDVLRDDFYYVYTNSGLVQVSDRASLLAALPDHRDQIAAFIERSGVSFRADPARAFTIILDEYAKISTAQ